MTDETLLNDDEPDYQIMASKSSKSSPSKESKKVICDCPEHQAKTWKWRMAGQIQKGGTRWFDD
ncbi:hypothetical protein PHISCL_01185 [Aspergillus sclerotialis]|uniref:Uncharacterized protein n=1 Tax=Aspergillus sclerotialis TaxID=2070753 RepID=A0A3A3A915_9EURO|nr:hypothetical protein PHISCL_01185 [Aspergillus sclerotialis]